MSRKKYKKKEGIFSPQGKINKTLLYIFIGLLIFGTLMIFDASVYIANSSYSDSFYFLKHHLIWLAIGIPLGIGAYLTNLKIISKLSFIFLAGTVILLILVLILGDDINGARRWFSIGAIPVQPAEFTKLALVIFLSFVLSKDTSKGHDLESQKKQFYRNLTTFGIIVISVLTLVILEPDMGTTMIIGITAFLLFFLSGEDRVHTIGSAIIGGLMALLAIIVGVVAPYRFERIQTFLQLLFTGEVANPIGEGYQIQQILIGIGSSGLFGKGFGQSRQRFGYLVENTAFTDSIFAVVLEELGFASALILVGLWLVVLWQGFRLTQRIENKFVKLLGAGIIIWLSSQALLNMAANVALIPLTGIPLPFFTYGGSSTIVTLVAIGLLLNVSRYAKAEIK